MHRPRFASPIVLLICFLAPCAAADEPGLKLKIQPALIPYSERSEEPTPMFLEVDRMQGHQNREFEAEGNASLRKRGAAVFADYLYYAFPERELTVTGHVRFEKKAMSLPARSCFTTSTAKAVTSRNPPTGSSSTGRAAAPIGW
jgi:hypothetical protein